MLHTTPRPRFNLWNLVTQRHPKSRDSSTSTTPTHPPTRPSHPHPSSWFLSNPQCHRRLILALKILTTLLIIILCIAYYLYQQTDAVRDKKIHTAIQPLLHATHAVINPYTNQQYIHAKTTVAVAETSRIDMTQQEYHTSYHDPTHVDHATALAHQRSEQQRREREAAERLRFSRSNPSALLMEEIYQLQHPSDCKTTKIMLAWPLNAGAGAHLSFVVNKLAMAIMLNRTLVPNNVRWNYRDCDEYNRPHGCSLLPMSSCVLEDTTPGEQNVIWTSDTQTDRVISQQVMSHVSSQFRDYMGLIAQAKDTVLKWIPDRWRPMGKLWYLSHLLGYVLRLPPATAARIAASQAAIGFYPSPHPLVGIHIRHGDKGSEGGAQVGIDHYVARAKELAIQLREQKLHNAYYDALMLNDTIRHEIEKAAAKVPTHVNLTLMVTTDDRKIADAIEKHMRGATDVALPGLPHIRYLIFPQDRTEMPQGQSEPLARLLDHISKDKRASILLDLLEDFYTLAMCNAHVLTLSSNFGCIAFALAHYLHYSSYNYATLWNETTGTFSVPPKLPAQSVDHPSCTLMGIQ